MRRGVIALFLALTLFLRGEEFHLSLNDHERYAISEIITTMGEKNIARLLLESGRLTGLGNSIQHVPPLQFLGFILINPHLKENLKRISKSMFKWPYFIDGLGANMEKELVEGRLLSELPSFLQYIGGCNKELLEVYVCQRTWDEFVKALL